jgi:hypothetical protein
MTSPRPQPRASDPIQTQPLRTPQALEASRERWSRWFEGSLDRGPMLHLEAPLDRSRREPRPLVSPATVEGRWTDPEYRVRLARNQLDERWYGGDAVPSWFANLGPGTVAAAAGPWPNFTEDSVWFREAPDPRLESILAELRFDSGNPYWLLVQELTRRSLEAAAGDYLVSLSDLGGDLDILASLRGTQALLMDLLEEPALVSACLEAIRALWFECFKLQEELIADSGQEGRTTWIPAWHTKPWAALQCDLAVMLSPRMFDQFALPELAEKSAAMERSIYHLDGPEEWRHLDSILSIPAISAIQYVSVPGDPPNEDPHWLPFYRKIAEAGKGLFIFAKDPGLVLELARGMPAERLAVHLCFESVHEAKDFLGHRLLPGRPQDKQGRGPQGGRHG